MKRRHWHHIDHAKRIGLLDHLNLFWDWGYQFDAHVRTYRWHLEMYQFVHRRFWERF